MTFASPQTHPADEIAIFVFVDAFGWRVFQEHQSLFLADELRLARPVDTVFGYSCSCDPTILTGCLPQQHGHFSFFQFAPERSPFRLYHTLKWLPKWLANRGRIRRQLSKFVAWQKQYSGYFQLYNVRFDRLPYLDYSEKKDLYQPTGILSGDPTIFDYLRKENIPFHVSDWRRSEQVNLNELRHELKSGEIRWAYLYLAGLDAILHRDGVTSAAATEHIAWYDKQLRSVLSVARQNYQQVRLYIFSDHGMTDVTSTSSLMLEMEELTERNHFQFGRDYGAIYDSTMARFWFRRDDVKKCVVDALQCRTDGRLLSDDDLRELGCLFPRREYGELFYLLNPGVLLCPSDMGASPMRGMHGYSPDHPDSTALIASTETFVPPARLDGLYSLMLQEAQRCDGRHHAQLAGPSLL